MTTSTMPKRRKLKVDPAAVVAYAIANPSMRQADVGVHFGISKSQTNFILRASGIKGICKGPKPKASYAEVAAYEAANPTKSQRAIGEHFGISCKTVNVTLRACAVQGIRRDKPKPGPKQRADYEAVAAYVAANPGIHYAAVGEHFGLSRARVNGILRTFGIDGICRGRKLKGKPWWSDEQAKWERILHDCGLGMRRGDSIHSISLIYGYDSSSVRRGDVSATLHS